MNLGEYVVLNNLVTTGKIVVRCRGVLSDDQITMITYRSLYNQTSRSINSIKWNVHLSNSREENVDLLSVTERILLEI